jgi:hypothetical protein
VLLAPEGPMMVSYLGSTYGRAGVSIVGYNFTLYARVNVEQHKSEITYTHHVSRLWMNT